MVKPVKFAHVVYMTRRFDEMIRWYRNVFEAEVVYENPALAFLTYDDEHHRFAFANLDVLKPGGEGRDDRGKSASITSPIRIETFAICSTLTCG
jgi:catechol 2,3-dioxygenase-like lactoylglutathione lyase family enzyme